MKIKVHDILDGLENCVECQGPCQLTGADLILAKAVCWYVAYSRRWFSDSAGAVRDCLVSAGVPREEITRIEVAAFDIDSDRGPRIHWKEEQMNPNIEAHAVGRCTRPDHGNLSQAERDSRAVGKDACKAILRHAATVQTWITEVDADLGDMEDLRDALVKLSGYDHDAMLKEAGLYEEYETFSTAPDTPEEPAG